MWTGWGMCMCMGVTEMAVWSPLGRTHENSHLGNSHGSSAFSADG